MHVPRSGVLYGNGTVRKPWVEIGLREIGETIATFTSDAWDEEYTLVIIGPSIAGKVGDMKLPLKLLFCLMRDETGEARVVPVIIGMDAYIAVDWGGNEAEKWGRVRLIVGGLRELIFYETLRVAVDKRQGVWCPMRDIPWVVAADGAKPRPLEKDECCGRREELLRLWQAGRKAGLLGRQWRRPTACVGCRVVPV